MLQAGSARSPQQPCARSAQGTGQVCGHAGTLLVAQLDLRKKA
jgi:hypothetical protein